MALSPATFYDENGVVRLQGQLDGGGGTTPNLQSFKYTFPFSFTVGGVPIQDDYLLFATLTAKTFVVDIRANVTVVWNAGGILTVTASPAGATPVFRSTNNLQSYTLPSGSDAGIGTGNQDTPRGLVQNQGVWLQDGKLYVTTDAAAVTGSVDLYVIAYVPS